MGIESILYNLLDKVTDQTVLSSINGIINGDSISIDDSNFCSLSKSFYDRLHFDHLKTKLHNPNAIIDIDELLEYYSLRNNKSIKLNEVLHT